MKKALHTYTITHSTYTHSINVHHNVHIAHCKGAWMFKLKKKKNGKLCCHKLGRDWYFEVNTSAVIVVNRRRASQKR